MWDSFKIYLQLGFEHILDINGYDHILFVLTLSAVYLVSDWRKILVLVTAFTIGHSITLALSVMEVITVSSSLIEQLIPITIILTALYNLFFHKSSLSNVYWLYGLTTFFGMIHGMGFSNYLKAIMAADDSFFNTLLPFNLGVEAGQIIIVLVGMLLSYLLIDKMKLSHTWWNRLISTSAAIIAIQLLMQRL